MTRIPPPKACGTAGGGGRRGLLAAVVIAVAGCGGGAHPTAREATTPATTATPTNAARRCDDDASTGAQAIRFRARDDVALSGAVVGSGPVGAVLIHEYPLDHCGWMPYAGYLARHGIRALAFDLRCFGQSACPTGRGHAVTDVAAAMAELRRRGARKVALVGASMGGAIAVVAAARLRAAAVIDLSGERNTTGLTPGIDANAAAAAPHLTAPALFAVAREDRYASVADMRTVTQRARSTTKRLIVLPATAGHGWNMLYGTGTEWSPLAATILGFIRHHAAS